MSTNVLVVGGGGREHALAWKLSQSEDLGKLYVAPGNPGMSEFAELVDVGAGDCEALVQLAVDKEVDLVVVGPEAPLVEGLVDMLAEKDIKAFGPNKAAAEIESSKAFSKKLMDDLSVPTAKYQVFTDYEQAKEYLEEMGAPIVVKASGLAAGKGAVVCQTQEEAQEALKEIMVDREFGEAGDEVVIEEFLVGPEISIHVLSDGQNYTIFPPSQDHKPVGVGNTGANTGGMGTVAPLPGVSDALMQQIEDEIVAPIINGMAEADMPYIGLLYPGIILTDDGPKVLEFNARFGDPETQSYMRILESDLLELMMACVDCRLNEVTTEWSDKTAVNIVLASHGYPGSYNKGKVISGPDVEHEDVVIFHAGTKLDGEDVVTNGGRVLGVTAVGDGLDDARAKGYAACEVVNFDGMQYRSDIGMAHDNSKLANF